MTAPLETADLQAVVERLEALLEQATPGPWAYRPCEHDDWGWIRGPRDDASMWAGPVVATAKSRRSMDEGDFDEHRRNRTDPYEPNGRLITEAINALPTLLAALRQPVEGDVQEMVRKLQEPYNQRQGRRVATEFKAADLLKRLSRTANVRDTGRGG